MTLHPRLSSARPVRAFLVAATLLAASSTLSSPAQADAYDALMSEGVVARDRAEETSDPKAWDEAFRAFAEADRIRPTKESRYELANAAIHLRAEDVACQAFEGAIALGLAGKGKEKAQAFLAANLGKMARLSVLGPAGARLSVQGRERGTLPLAHPIVVFAGSMRARLVSPDGRVVEKDVVAPASSTAEVDLNPDAPIENVADSPPRPAPQHRSSTLGWVLVGSGAAVFAGGLVTYFVANGTVTRRRDDLAHDCGVRNGDECAVSASIALQGAAQSDVDAIATGKTFRVVGIATAGVGAAAAIWGLIRLASAPSEPATAAVSPQVLALPGGVFFGASGAF